MGGFHGLITVKWKHGHHYALMTSLRNLDI
jgi:hypothetical protein